MRFSPTPVSPDDRPLLEPSTWRWILLISAAVGAWATTMPWIRVQFERLFGSHEGPPGWHSSAGFTCLCTSMLVAVMSFVETGTETSRHAVRPGSLLLAALATLVVTLEWWSGPGFFRGVSATWTPWFYVLLASTPLLLAACARRWAALAWNRARYNSSGPLT